MPFIMKPARISRAMLIVIFIFFYNNGCAGQSNYASHANSIEYQGEGLPEEATLDGKVTKLDDLSPIIFLNRTKAALNCAAGSMQVELKFNEKFYGTAYANFDRNSACQITGKGETSYSVELPLKGCGTKQEPQRVFTNNIVVRFHPGLEMDGDEIITIVCRYPPPVAPIPAGIPFNEPRLPGVIPASILDPPLKGIQILFIICAIMFLTLLLIGLGVSYYCLRRQPVSVVRRVIHVGSGSEITALETGSIGSVSGLKLPHHAHVSHQTQSVSGSDGVLIPSDYPSESHSENEEVDTGSLPISSHGSYENSAFLQDASSIYSDHYGRQEIRATANYETSPKFDIHVRVKRTPPPLPSPLTSDTDSNTTVSRAERNNLSTILESHEDARSDSVLTIESLQEAGQTQFTYTPELHSAPRYITSPQTVSKSLKTQQQNIQLNKWPDNYPGGPQQFSTRSLVSLGTEMTDTHSMTEIIDSSHLYPISYQDAFDFRNNEHIEPQIIVTRKNDTSSHIVDDVFTQTVTEKTTIEDVEKHKRMIIEYKAKPVVDPNWNVTIRNYQENSDHKWEDFSDVSSTSGMTISQPLTKQMTIPTSTYISEKDVLLRSPDLVGNMKPIELPPEDKTITNWDVLIRVLEDVEVPDISIATASLQNSRAVVPLASQLSYDDKAKWKEIITTESTLRTMLTEAVMREDFERIRADARYEKLFEPQSWEIIMRILAPADDDAELRRSKRKKREAWDTRSRRSSLPTLYEYDSDGGSSVRTITQEPITITSQNRDSYGSLKSRSRKTSRSSFSSNNVDYRSMTEVMVDFAKPKYPESFSDESSYTAQPYYEGDNYEQLSVHRSTSHPSLARSESEFTERWIAPENIDSSTSEISPQLGRRERTLVVETAASHIDNNHQIMHNSQSVDRYINARQTTYTTTTNRNKDW